MIIDVFLRVSIGELLSEIGVPWWVAFFIVFPILGVLYQLAQKDEAREQAISCEPEEVTSSDGTQYVTCTKHPDFLERRTGWSYKTQWEKHEHQLKERECKPTVVSSQIGPLVTCVKHGKWSVKLNEPVTERQIQHLIAGEWRNHLKATGG